MLQPFLVIMVFERGTYLEKIWLNFCRHIRLVVGFSKNIFFWLFAFAENMFGGIGKKLKQRFDFF